MPLKTGHVLPVLVEEEYDWVVVVLMQAVFETTFFLPSGSNEFQQLPFNRFNGVYFDGQLGNNGNYGYGLFLFSWAFTPCTRSYALQNGQMSCSMFFTKVNTIPS